jgi:transposase
MQLTIGIDISKKTFDAALLRPDQPAVRRKFANKLSGFSELHQWVETFQPGAVTLAMEATGVYGEALAVFCFHLGWTVFVLNPARIKAYGVAVGQRNKTDRADCLTIGLYAQKTPGLVPWVPPTEAQSHLRALVRERLYLQQILLADQARHMIAGVSTRKIIAERIEFLQEQIGDLWKQIKKLIRQEAALAQAAQLISSIPGIGAWTAAVLLSELPQIDPKTSARKVAALFGLCPRNVESGSSVRKPGRLSRAGRGVIRHQLYMPAVVALKHNELIRAWAEKLRQRGKTGKQIVAAVIHRLLRIAVGVLKTRKAFQADWKGVPA